jgi:hypothetical protein
MLKAAMRALTVRPSLMLLAVAALTGATVVAADKPITSQAPGPPPRTNAAVPIPNATNSLSGFLRSLREPIVLDQNPERRTAKKGRTNIDEIAIFALKDAGGTRFCIFFYGAYGEAWLKKEKRPLLVLLPRPIEKYAWGGYAPARGSQEEKEVARIVAAALGENPKKYLEAVPRYAKP